MMPSANDPKGDDVGPTPPVNSTPQLQLRLGSVATAAGAGCYSASSPQVLSERKPRSRCHPVIGWVRHIGSLVAVLKV